MPELLLTQQLPLYSPPSTPPSYSSLCLQGEETLLQTSSFYSSLHPTGTFVKHVGGITLLLSHQHQDTTVPLYGYRGTLGGSIELDSSIEVEDIREVTLKVEGRMMLSIPGSNLDTIKTINSQYELWSNHDPTPSTATCPRTIPFSSTLPTTFKDAGHEFPLPPSYETDCESYPDVFAKCTYKIRATVKTHGSLWTHKKTVSIPFFYCPRKHPSRPILATRFLSTIKTLPEEWHQTTSVLRPRSNAQVGPISASIFIPASQIFGIRDHIPYHIQLSGPILSIKEFYSQLPYDSKVYTPSPCSNNRSKHSTSSMRVSLLRQIRVQTNGQSMFNSYLIGSGTLVALPPLIELNESPTHPAQEMALDWKGEIQCREDINIGHFDAGRLSASEFLLFLIECKPRQGAYEALRMSVPVFLVTDTWVEN